MSEPFRPKHQSGSSKRSASEARKRTESAKIFSKIKTFFMSADSSASVLKQFAEVTTPAWPANYQVDSLDQSDDDEIEIRPTEVHELENTYGDLSNAEQSKQFTESECALCALNDIGGYITNQSDSISKLSQPSTEQKIDIVNI